jgi:hypothetical protein
VELRFGTAIRLESADGDSERVALPVDDGILHVTTYLFLSCVS